MKGLAIASLFLALAASDVFAQAVTPKSTIELDIALGLGKEVFTGALGAMRWHRLGATGKLQLGYGHRLTGAVGGVQDFVTAPASLTRANSGFVVALFSEQRTANLDTLTVPGSTIAMLNAAVGIRYQFTKKLSAGFNIDVLGVSFGSVDIGHFTARSQNLPISSEASTPTSFNLLLIGDNDRGSLSSVIYVQYQFNETWGVRAGLSHLFTETTASRKLALDNDRFRNITDLGVVGITYSF